MIRTGPGAVDTWGGAIDAVMAERITMPGFARRPTELLGRPRLDRTFMERCRRAFLHLGPRLDGRGLIAVVSPHRTEGRSTVAAGLALSIAQDSDLPVLLLDLDLASPGQSSLFSIPPGPGLTDYLRGAPRLRLVSGGPDRRLWLMPAGTVAPDAARLLHQLAASDLFAACRERFAWIVADLGPLIDDPSAVPLSAAADGYVLVGRYRSTTLAALERTAAMLRSDRPAGFVMSSDSSRIPGWVRRLI
jgi:Mrp family chromosome partitioning ATPase